MSPRLFFLLGFFALLLVPGFGQTDDFNDGNDTGWTRLDPIGEIINSPYAGYQVQSGLYRLSCDPTPDPQAGPARVASYRADQVYGDFLVVVDVVSWNAALDQAIGILARVQANPGPGATSGYSLNYQPVDQDIEINRLTGETPFNLMRVTLNLPPGDSYRFVFQGRGNQLTAAVFNLAEPLLPLVTLSATDGAYSAGYCGLFAFDASGTGAVNATFDSYGAGPALIPALDFAAEAGEFTVRWPRLTGAWHLETGTGLTDWADVTAGGGVLGEGLFFTAPVSGRRFYRLAEGWAGP